MSTDIRPDVHADAAFGNLYSEVQQFYARHFYLLDSGATEEWTETLAEDARFALPTLEPVRGRSAISAAMRRGHAARAEAGEVHRHWHGMPDIERRPDGSLRVRCYALVFATAVGGDSRLHRVCLCEDVLVRGPDGRLLLRTRRVSRDDQS